MSSLENNLWLIFGTTLVKKNSYRVHQYIRFNNLDRQFFILNFFSYFKNQCPKIKKIVVLHAKQNNNILFLTFHFGIAATLLGFFFLIWRKIILGRLQGFQKHIEHWDLFELLGRLIDHLVWLLLLAFWGLHMMFRTVDVLKRRRIRSCGYYSRSII